MHRRSLLVGLLSVACAPHQEPDSSPEQPADPPRSNTLLALGHWSAPVSAWMQELAVYEDGLVELLWFENVEHPNNPFARELRLRSIRVAAAELDPLREALTSPAFASAEPYYDEEGVLDGGSLTIADQASHNRRVTVVNEPSDTPREVRRAQALLGELAEMTKRRGSDAFAEGPDRIVVVWQFLRGKTSKRLTVRASGLVELRTVYTMDERAHEARDYPTPYASTRRADPADVEALEAALTAVRPEAVPHNRAEGGTLWLEGGVEQHIPSAPSPQLVRVASLLEAMELSLS